jgi:hypothetical protein
MVRNNNNILFFAFGPNILQAGFFFLAVLLCLAAVKWYMSRDFKKIRARQAEQFLYEIDNRIAREVTPERALMIEYCAAIALRDNLEVRSRPDAQGHSTAYTPGCRGNPCRRAGKKRQHQRTGVILSAYSVSP